MMCVHVLGSSFNFRFSYISFGPIEAARKLLLCGRQILYSISPFCRARPHAVFLTRPLLSLPLFIFPRKTLPHSSLILLTRLLMDEQWNTPPSPNILAFVVTS